LEEHVKKADLVFAATGKPHLIKGDWIKKGAVVIDIGISEIEHEGKMRVVGDVEFHKAKDKSRLLTPVPGGVGPLTVTMLMRNVIVSWCSHNNIQNTLITDKPIPIHNKQTQ